MGMPFASPGHYYRCLSSTEMGLHTIIAFFRIIITATTVIIIMVRKINCDGKNNSKNDANNFFVSYNNNDYKIMNMIVDHLKLV